MESFEARLNRFLNGSLEEIPLTLTSSISNFLLPQIQEAKNCELFELMLLGTHAVILIISEKVFGFSGLKATKFYLQNFVDGTKKDTKYSLVSSDIHYWRNNIAHQWLSCRGHTLLPDPNMKEGWKYENNLLKFNPKIYGEYFIEGYKTRGIFLKYRQLLTNHQKLLRKYEFIRDWLSIRRTDQIYLEIKKLKSFTSTQDVQKQERIIRNLISQKYCIT